MLAIVLMDHALRHRGQNADVQCATPKISGKTATDQQKTNEQLPKKQDPEPEEDL